MNGSCLEGFDKPRGKTNRNTVFYPRILSVSDIHFKDARLGIWRALRNITHRAKVSKKFVAGLEKIP